MKVARWHIHITTNLSSHHSIFYLFHWASKSEKIQAKAEALIIKYILRAVMPALSIRILLTNLLYGSGCSPLCIKQNKLREKPITVYFWKASNYTRIAAYMPLLYYLSTTLIVGLFLWAVIFPSGLL